MKTYLIFLTVFVILAAVTITNTSFLNEIKLIHYYGPNFTDHTIYTIDDADLLLESKNFNSNQKTAIYIHGYLENQNVESIHAIVEAYNNQRTDHNLLIVDYAELVNASYTLAVFNVNKVGETLAKTILKLINAGVEVNSLHVIGHSLGGQVAGVVGRKVQLLTNGAIKIKRISALDPAFPPFYFNPLRKHLSKSDAEFVDVIHTDAWRYGAPIETGTVDFWPNGGNSLQPGCPRMNNIPLSKNNLCSHVRSWILWVESLNRFSVNKFFAVSANSWIKFKSGDVRRSKTVTLGIDCPIGINGSYFLQTNDASPYAKGESGIYYVTSGIVF